MWETLVTGTSQATPHVSGTIALLKSLHPTWLPSYFFSALQTTGIPLRLLFVDFVWRYFFLMKYPFLSALEMTNRKNPIPFTNGVKATPFDMGFGHINPNSAVDPGLVFPITNHAYTGFLCSPDSGLGSPNSTIDPSLYCRKFPSTKALHLNLPSISFFNVKAGISTSTRRFVKNVGPPSTYTVVVKSPLGSVLKVSPTKLEFRRDKVLSFNVKVIPYRPSDKVQGVFFSNSTRWNTVQAKIAWTFGSITWADNKGHKVRSVVVLNSVR